MNLFMLAALTTRPRLCAHACNVWTKALRVNANASVLEQYPTAERQSPRGAEIGKQREYGAPDAVQQNL
jgi:hypothetical protein